MTYYLYHIPGKKIGVTRNLEERVHKQQGYHEGEYTILAESEDISEISTLEIQMQRAFGYKVDRQLYKNLKCNKKEMKINVTEQTTTFPVKLTKVREALENEPSLAWKTSFGRVVLCPELINWIVTNAHESRYNSERSYVYNKALWEAFTEINSLESLKQQFKPGTTEKVNHQLSDLGLNHFDLIRAWAAERGIYEKGNAHTQYVKLQEEAGELAKALLNKDKPEIKDAIGDIVVVLTNLAYLEGFTIEECIESAYAEIANRKGKMINGTFVKELEVHEEEVL